jgi:DNA-binding transcriptional ArsR family regulator
MDNILMDIATDGDADEDFRKVTLKPRSYHAVFDQRRDGFVTVPQLSWAEIAGGLQVKPGVILALWFKSFTDKTLTVKFSSELAERFGVDRRAKQRGLKRLESAGLVSVVYSKGRSPLVTILSAVERKER